MGMQWICSICGKIAHYHSTASGKHMYYCQECWWTKYLQNEKGEYK